MVDHCDEHVDMLLLADQILYKGMDFAIDKRIELEGVGMGAGRQGGAGFVKHGTVGSKETAVPVRVLVR